MYFDGELLDKFYASPLGVRTHRFVADALGNARKELSSAERVCGVGFTVPYAKGLYGRDIISVLPMRMGTTNGGHSKQGDQILGECARLPIAGESMDEVLVSHGFEFAENPRQLLRECWRILVPGGHLIAIVPNRVGIWSRSDVSPFSCGAPFSRAQLVQFLSEGLMTPIHVGGALYTLPVRGMAMQMVGRGLETLHLGPAGLFVVLAEKRLYGMHSVSGKRLVGVPAEPVGGI